MLAGSGALQLQIGNGLLAHGVALRPSVIVLLTMLTGSKNEPMCTNFWQPAGARLQQLRHHRAGGRRGIKTVFMQYRWWNCDDTIPDNLFGFRDKLELAVAQQEKQQTRHGMEPGPVVLLCLTDVHHCGTFAALGMVCNRLVETKDHFVGLQDTVTALRGQCWGCVEHFEHYRKLSDLVTSFAMDSGIVGKGAILATSRQAGGQRRPNYN